MSTGHPLRSAFTVTKRRVGLLSTYPPKLCGLATFAVALEDHLRRDGNQVDIVRIDDGEGASSTGRTVRAELINGDQASIRAAAAVLSRCDVAIIQHEYGIYGGPDGDEVIDVLEALAVPAIVVLHTVPLTPTPHQRSLLVQICDMADCVVVMSSTARQRLTDLYSIDLSNVVTIPHGASVAPYEPDRHADFAHSHPQLLTWGLLGPGKGVEHAIDALAMLSDLRPRPRYTVAGVTHPKVFARNGDQYRHSLIQRSWSAGVAGAVTFDDTYRDVAELTRFVSSASVVLLPYDSRDQVTSGVLVDAIAAGVPVVSTSFPHAVELLSTGAGLVVPQQDPAALARAIRTVLTEEGVREAMAAEARRIAPSLSWSSVAAQYVAAADRLMTRDRIAI